MLLKKIFLFCSIFLLLSCAELQQVVNTIPTETGIGMDSTTIANGLRQALDKGIDKQVTKLTQKDGFYKRDIGLGSLADEGIKALNRAAEDAVKEATPIFVSAVKGITFADAKNILLGSDNAATNYLEQRTSSALYSKFNPVIKQSFSKVGADQIWTNIITKYNSIPFVTKVNPDLTDYVTTEALQGVYKMISVEEKDIRNNISARTTTLLRQVFALQD